MCKNVPYQSPESDPLGGFRQLRLKSIHKSQAMSRWLLKNNVEAGLSLSLRQPHAKVEEHSSRLVGCFPVTRADLNLQLARVIRSIQCSFDMLLLLLIEEGGR